MKKTFKQVQEFNNAVNSFMTRNEINKETKLGYAIIKISNGAIKKILREYQLAYQELYYEKVQRVHIDAALTDKVTGAVLQTPRGSERPYMYDAAGLKAVMECERAFVKEGELFLDAWNEKEFEFEPHYAVEVPEDITPSEKEAFTGFVIAPEEEK
jgi:hypothetical protein